MYGSLTSKMTDCLPGIPRQFMSLSYAEPPDYLLDCVVTVHKTGKVISAERIV